MLFLTPALSLIGQEIKSSSSQEFSSRLDNLIYTLNRWHVSPIENGDTLSNRVYQLFIREFDPYLLFLTEESSDILKNYQYDLDDQIEKGDYIFIDTCASIALNGIKRIQEEWFDDIDVDFVLSYADTAKFNRSREDRIAGDLVGLENRFKKWITYQILVSTYSNFPDLNLADNDSVSNALSYSISQEKSFLTCMFEDLGFPDKTTIKAGLEDLFLNAVAQAFDPHSNFYSKDQKNDLETMLSPSEDSFGITLYDENNSIKVNSIHQRSDAWRSNLINVDDVIKQAKDQNGEALIDNCTSAYELEELLSSTSVSSVTLSVIKPSGKEITVELIKETLSSEENSLVAYVLKGKTSIGYISLPSFYTSWESDQVDGCANDVAKEILKLREDSISGLILDLRNNGGGSVVEALDLAGIFIDIGPLGIMKSATGKPKLMKDFNRGAAYTDPLIILINGASASASEIVAGALKYHQRAVIVGSDSYGKATSQVVIPTDSTLWFDYMQSTDDFVKVTTSNIYQPDLSSHQLYGVQPDIKIPSPWESFYTKEADEFFPLVPDKISKNVYFTPSLTLPIEQLQEKSNNRIKNDALFTRIKTIDDSLYSEMNDPFSVAINLNTIYSRNLNKDSNYDKLLDDLELSHAEFSFEISTFYESISNMDKTFNKNATRLKYEMEKDPVLNETFLILTDLIELKTTK
ncbi:hypothetical protein CRYO30217_02199 [Parvicella tangerina]|uniref:Tail specific protease domain-containing protein n=2 Tax=Parvicella tangerina TaxID=2829795 RepID=A0A916JP45_9FLAO|nr:hypothetical protein CRYO30217_02199 [Parvicella tangerina]